MTKTYSMLYQLNPFYILLASILFMFIYFVYQLIFNKKGTYITPSSYLSNVLPPTKSATSKMSTGLSGDDSLQNSLQNNSSSRGEQRCKEVMERFFKKPFTKVRPQFLRNEVTGKHLELDLYNEELNLSVEYNGRQHYDYVPYFHKNREAYHNQRYRDEMKKGKCKELGIRLIEVPYTVKERDIETYLRNELEKLGYNFI